LIKDYSLIRGGIAAVLGDKLLDKVEGQERPI